MPREDKPHLKVGIRPAVVGDAAMLARVHVDSWRAAYARLVPEDVLARFNYPRREQDFRAALAEEREETYVIEVGEEPVGILTIGPVRDGDLDSAKVGEIWGIYLVPAQWRRGIGAKCLEWAESILRSRSYTELVLWVLEANDRARRFYEAAGYQLDGAKMEIDWGTPLTALRYRKSVIPEEPIRP